MVWDIPTIRSNRPIPMTGAIVQNVFQNNRYVYSKTLEKMSVHIRHGDGASLTIDYSKHSRSGTTITPQGIP